MINDPVNAKGPLSLRGTLILCTKSPGPVDNVCLQSSSHWSIESQTECVQMVQKSPCQSNILRTYFCFEPTTSTSIVVRQPRECQRQEYLGPRKALMGDHYRQAVAGHCAQNSKIGVGSSGGARKSSRTFLQNCKCSRISHTALAPHQYIHRSDLADPKAFPFGVVALTPPRLNCRTNSCGEPRCSGRDQSVLLYAVLEKGGGFVRLRPLQLKLPSLNGLISFIICMCSKTLAKADPSVIVCGRWVKIGD
nr:hypothetical protein CFP56_67769 [Quercus suber]